MRTVNKTAYILLLLLLAAMVVSCMSMSTGQYMPLYQDETVIGTIQASFYVQSSFPTMKNGKETLNTQAYASLMEAARREYSGIIDLRDIEWVMANSSSGKTGTEILAVAKVIRISGVVA